MSKQADLRTQDRSLQNTPEVEPSTPVPYTPPSDWNNLGDVDTHPDVEWVPTDELRKFVEYDRRPHGKDYQGNDERWKALGEHIKQNGFTNPVVLEYNQDTGMAHMGEGNHRTWIALEHGIPAMPVRVYSGGRTSPADQPVTLQELPEWENHLGEQHVPQSLKPSHIGLPTVPPPGQQVRARAARTAWTFA